MGLAKFLSSENFHVYGNETLACGKGRQYSTITVIESEANS